MAKSKMITETGAERMNADPTGPESGAKHAQRTLNNVFISTLQWIFHSHS